MKIKLKFLAITFLISGSLVTMSASADTCRTNLNGKPFWQVTVNNSYLGSEVRCYYHYSHGHIISYGIPGRFFRTEGPWHSDGDPARKRCAESMTSCVFHEY